MDCRPAIVTLIVAVGTVTLIESDACADLIHYWSFDCSTVDLVGNSGEVEIVGAEMVATKTGMGHQLDEDSDPEPPYIESHFVPQLAPSAAMSIACWAKMPSEVPGSYQDIVGLELSDHQQIRLLIDPYNGELISSWRDDNHDESNISHPGICDGRWHHFVMIRDGANGTTQLHVDGSLIGTAPGAAGPINVSSSRSLYFGNNNHSYVGPDCPFHSGIVDEIRVYDHVLSEQEVRALVPSDTLLPSDVNGDGIVNVVDLLQVLSDWGETCP